MANLQGFFLKAAVHDNNALSNVEKFNYLQSYLERDITVISGFNHLNKNKINK